MRIRTQFIITMFLFGIVLAAIAYSAIVTNQLVEQARQQGENAASVAQGAVELSYLSNDYVIFRESQQYNRWQARYTAFASEVAVLQANDPEQQALVHNIQVNTQRIKEVFDSVVTSLGTSSTDQVGIIDPALVQVSWSRMAVQSQGLVSDASRLSVLLSDQANQRQRVNFFVVLATILVFGAYYLANYLLFQRRTLKSIAKLQAGTAQIGSGDLNFRVEEKRNDEIGDLSRAFNMMAADLKTVTASKTDLEREIDERKTAEEALKKSEGKYRNLFDTMSEGFGLHEIILDADGKPCDYRFLELNDAFEKMTGLSREKSLGKTVKETIPNVESFWIEKYGKVALTGEPTRFESYTAALGKWYGTFAFSPAKGQFAVLFSDITERKENEQKLMEQAAILANVNDAIISYNPDYQITYWNSAAEEIYGYSGAEAMGKISHVLLQPTYTNSTRGQLVQRLAREGHLEAESGRRAKDGRQITVETHVISLHDDAGKLTGYIAVDRDITERNRTNERLIASETRYRRLFESAKDGILIIDADSGKVIDVNPFLLTLLGYNLEELMSKQLWEIGLFENIIPSRAAYIELQNKGYIRYEDLPLETKHGNRIEVEFISNVYQVDYSRVVQCNIRDITERKKAERALRETSDYLNNLINYANAPIIVWDPEFKITRFNHAFERLTGRTANEVLGKKLDFLFPDDSRHESMHIVHNAAVEKLEVVEIPILHRDGTVKTVLWNSATIFASDDKTPLATIAQGQDITKRKMTEEELKQSNLELEATNKELEAFSYSVSHDLRAPLRSLEGFSSALLEDYDAKLDDTGKKYLGYIKESSDLMGRIIDDLLKLSRVTRSDMNYESTDLSDLATKIIAELEKVEPDRKVKVTIAPGLTVYGDRSLLRLALENLIGNAWKFTGKSAAPEIEIGVTDKNGKRAFFIRDNGAGFDMTYVDKLFKPFQRLHKTVDFAGTGIGLATVLRIIRRHGGEVWAESHVGQGATFYFTLS